MSLLKDFSDVADITVCIMSYKYGHLLAQALESVLAQAVKPAFIKVFDDGAGDCRAVTDLYSRPAPLGPPYIFLFENEENWGIVRNFNSALHITETPRVLFLGADNYLRPDALEKMDAVDADIVSCDVHLVGPKAKESAPVTGTVWTHDGYPTYKADSPHGSSLYNVKLAKQVGGYAASGNKNSEEDTVLFKKMMGEGGTLEYVREPLLYYRKHEANFQR